MAAGPAASDPIFVVQHHLATADHYDVRLEIGGVLVSWAVPKGPPAAPGERRLAIRTGDHDLAYADYEGVLSAERRGGGVVQVWDRGTFRTTSTRRGTPVPATEALADGRLSVELSGRKLVGGFSMIRTDGATNWLMVRRRGAGAGAAPDPVHAEPESVLTGRTMAEIAEQD